MPSSPRSSRTGARLAIAAAGVAATLAAWSVPNAAHALEPWMLETPLPQAAAQRLAVTADDGLVYLFGGRGAADVAHAYDPVTDTFTELASLPVTTAGACGDQLSDGRIVVYGGVDPVTFSYRPQAQIYDPVADTWAMGAELAGTWACAAAADDTGNLHVFGGQAAQTRYAIYDGVADSWSLGPSIPQAQRRYAHIAVRSNDGRYFLLGGRFSEGTWSIFDPSNDTWTEAGNLPAPRVWAAGASDGERVYVMGGSDNALNDEPPMFDTVWELDMVTEVWDPMQPVLVTGVREATGAWVDGALHVFGGSDAALVTLHQVAPLEGGAATGTGSDTGSDTGTDTDASDSGDTGTGDGGRGSTSTGPSADTTAGAVDDTVGDTGVMPPTTTGIPGNSTGPTTGDTTSGTGSGGATSTGDGCSCRATDRAPAWSWCLWVAVMAWRRSAHQRGRR